MKKESPKLKKTAQPRKISIPALAAALAIILAIIALFSPPFQAPEKLAENQTISIEEGVLFAYEITRYPTNVEISNASGQNISLGFSLEPGNLNFGIVPTGGNMGKRVITLENVADAPSKILLVAYGSIAPMIKFSGNDFLLTNKAPKPIEITLETEKGTALGNYSGEIDIIVKKPKYGFAERLM